MANQCVTVNMLAPANIISTDIVLNPTSCIEPCDITVTVTWQNTGDLSGQFTPSIIVDSGAATTKPLEPLNGGETVPHSFTVTGLVGGTHTIQTSPGPVQQTINVTTRGNVSFSSNPTGAKIFVDGTDTGLITPNTVTYLIPGPHTYKLSLTGYRDNTGTISVISNQTIIMPTLDMVLATGDAYIESTPSGAKIFIDDTDTGRTTPSPIYNISVGTHTYRLTLAGYVDSTGSFDIFQDQPTSLSVTMVILPGSLIVQSTPPGAKIWVALTGETPTDTGIVTPNDATPISLAPDTYDVKLTFEHYYDYTVTDISITTQNVTTLTDITLIPIPSSLVIESDPSGAEIWFAAHGGTLANQSLTTPNTLNPISITTPGDYDFKLVLANYYDKPGTITVRPEQTLTITETLEPLPGSLAITSTPPGAEISVDGSPTGLITPNTVTDVPVGTHTIVLSLVHYNDSPETVVPVGPNETVTVPDITLSPKPGELVIDSTPSGAKIFIDGSDTGLTTPNTVIDVPVGTHTIGLILTNYVEFTTTVSIEPERTFTQTYKLTPRPGTLTIISTPPGAEIWLALTGSVEPPTDTGVITPNDVINILPETYDALLTLTHYNDLSITGIVISPNQGTTITEDKATLTPKPGFLDITSTPLGAEIYINDFDQGVTTRSMISGLLPGDYNIKLTLANYYDYVSPTPETIGPDQGKYLDISLVPRPGNLSITSTPTGASIYIDGVQQSGTTPKTITNLDPITHTVKLTHSEYRDYTIDVNIGPNQTVDLNATMVLLPGGLIVNSIPPGASIYIDDVLQIGVTTSIFALDEGIHTLKLSLTGYYDVEQTFNITHMQTTTISSVLTEATGDIAISSTPSGAQISIDDLDIGLTTPATITRLLTGSHSYKLTLSGYKDATGTFNIMVGQMTTLSVALTLQVAQAGFGLPEMILIGGIGVGMLIMSRKG